MKTIKEYINKSLFEQRQTIYEGLFDDEDDMLDKKHIEAIYSWFDKNVKFVKQYGSSDVSASDVLSVNSDGLLVLV